MKRVFGAMCAVMVLWGCSSVRQDAEDRRREVIQNVCNDEQVTKSGPMIAIAYVNAQGAVVRDGDVMAVVQQAQENRKAWKTVLATTRNSSTSRRFRSVCTVQQWINPYQWVWVNVPCEQREDLSLADVYGIGRADSYEEAEDLAIQNCEALAESFAESTGVSSYNSALECKVLLQRICNM
ncbi:hypothetical protein [Pseudomonas sp. DG56-2]|uniref:hypothetical protein n=1 Tax=Pseudomonas sp. DG56-2 TaxID=2320270 RepID=UPI0010A647C3|nr:hypothetical protein [Pseudomonas sp. DG56-2]